ncbi:MAG: PmoA family protein [Bacteroidales bacterium]|nr:PmoA family protein [Bacteroidales bacterium]
MKIAGVFFLGFFPFFLFSQEVASFSVSAGGHEQLDCPVYFAPDQINDLSDRSSLHLFEIVKSGLQEVNFQFENESSNGFWFILDGKTPKNTQRHFLLRTEKKIKAVSLMQVEQSKDALVLMKNEQRILKYQKQTIMPPKGVDPIYGKSGFIHPLWSPGGEVLTRIQPPDHYHHYGIWGPWTKTHIDEREVDFWNLAKAQGTVKYEDLLAVSEGPVFCGISVHQLHVDFGQKGKNEKQVALNEELSVRAWSLGENAWLIDYTSTQSSPLKNGILLDAYRYGGGIGFRATEKWKKDNCTVLTSEGKTRENADGTTARWCRLEGESIAGRSGVLFMDNPENKEYPQPMRVWPLDSNNKRGDLFFEFCPIRHNSWKMGKGKDYQLKYRLYVFDGDISALEAESIWQGFAHPPKVTME